jgi:hypothetical protein
MDFSMNNRFGILALTLVPSLFASPKIITSELDRLGPEFNSFHPTSASSTTAPAYPYWAKPFDPVEFAKFAVAFSLPAQATNKADAKIHSVAAPGKTLLYMEEKSEIFFDDETAADRDRSDSETDDQKKVQAEALLRKIIGKDAGNFVFVNDEKTYAQENSATDPVEIAYYARYARVVEGRPILGNQFQVRIALGHKGCLKEFSFRDPVLGSRKVLKAAPSENLPDRLLGAINANPARNTPSGPLPITSSRPYKRFPAFVVSEETGVGQLLPVTSFLAENAVDPLVLNSAEFRGLEPTYVEHYNIPETQP